MQEYEGKKCIETVSEKFNFEIFPVANIDAASFLLCNHFAKINANDILKPFHTHWLRWRKGSAIAQFTVSVAI